MESDWNTCAICIENYRPGDIVRVLPCRCASLEYTNSEIMRTPSGGIVPRRVLTAASALTERSLTFTPTRIHIHVPVSRSLERFRIRIRLLSQIFSIISSFSSLSIVSPRHCAFCAHTQHTLSLSHAQIIAVALSHLAYSRRVEGPTNVLSASAAVCAVRRVQRRRERMCAIHSIRLRLRLSLSLTSVAPRLASPRLDSLFTYYSTRP